MIRNSESRWKYDPGMIQHSTVVLWMRVLYGCDDVEEGEGGKIGVQGGNMENRRSGRLVMSE